MSESNILNNIKNSAFADEHANAVKRLASLLDADATVGELLSLSYGDATVLVHDYVKPKVRGLPHGCFLIASRLHDVSNIPSRADDEDAGLILLRIVGTAPLPNSREMDEFRFQAGMRSTDSAVTWDHPSRIDDWTRNNLSYGAYKCRVLGTFRMKRVEGGALGHELSFGGDLLNFYNGRGMKVYKPAGELLNKIVNYFKGSDTGSENHQVRVGRVRFASSEVGVDESKDNVPVLINPYDFLSRRTFYGGMSRGGKSNAMKISARSIYLLRNGKDKFRVGQLIFDPNGEYANENAQDGGALKNIYLDVNPEDYAAEIETYGLNPHPNDKQRKIVKINFYGSRVESREWSSTGALSERLEQLMVGKQLIDGELFEAQAQYVKRFRDTRIEVPEVFLSMGESKRFQRLVLVYQSILCAAGFAPPSEKALIKGLFSEDIRQAMKQNSAADATKKLQIANAGEKLSNGQIAWDDFVAACKGLREFINEKDSGYEAFEQNYSKAHDGRSWLDDNLRNILEIYAYPNGVSSFRRLRSQHSADAQGDYAKSIVDALRAGKLVIFDQSTGDPQQNQSAAERILWAIFNAQKQDFVSPKISDSGELTKAPPVMVYIEEAHNLLPSAGNKDDLKSIWARVAKEGSKYQIGLVLATQEPSSVMPAILKNTDNWFVAHLNNADEVRAVSKFYDFDDYAQQIKSISDPGFVRMRTLSNPYTIPVQIDLFTAKVGK